MSGKQTVSRKRNNQREGEMKLLLKELRLLELQMKRSAQPPKWLANPPQFRRVRFGVIANQVEVDVTTGSLLFFQSLATTTTNVCTLALAVKLKCVRIWFTALTAGTAVSATIEWNAAATGFLIQGTSVGETNTSTTEPVLLEARPPGDTLSGWYQGGATALTNVIFSFSAPADAILEIDYDWVLNSTEPVFTTGSTVASASVGQVCCKAINSNVQVLPPLNSVV